MSNKAIVPQDVSEAEKWQPDIYYFPVQVDAELDDIQSNFLGKVLTLIDALGLNSKQEKAIKDLIRTVVKEQMIGTRQMLDNRLKTILELGMKPIDMESSTNFSFQKSYIVTPVYQEKDLEVPQLP